MKLLHVRRNRFALLIAAVVLCFSAVFAKLHWLHIQEAPRLRDEAQKNRRIFRQTAANRGDIVDVRSTVLATTRLVFDIGVDPKELTDEQRKRAPEVAKILGISVGEVEEAFKPKVITRIIEIEEAAVPGSAENGTSGEIASIENANDTARKKTMEKQVEVRWVKLRDGQTEQIRDKIAALGIPAVYGNQRFIRYYPKGELAAHLVGYVNRENIPAMGIEKAMDFFLRGQGGWMESQKDSKKTELAHLREREIKSLDGQKIELTIDSILQEICEEQLKEIAAKYQPKSASIIVSSPVSGNLLALGNYPTFDLNKFNDPSAAPIDFQRNRAVTDIYEPGSVFKIVAISMGLNEGLVTPDTIFDCGAESAPYRGKMLPLPKDSHAIGTVDVREIVRQSSNRGSVLVALRVAETRGEQTLYDYAHNFGFGQPTGLITGTESDGILHKVKNWDGLTVTRFPMGHAIGVTPLQMHYAMGAIANGGRLMEPKLISRVINPDGTVALVYPSKQRSAPVRPDVAVKMVRLLRDVCAKGGTAARAEIPGYEVAGKTGTSQKIINGYYSTSHHVASFSGFFPASNPRYVITIVVDDANLSGVAYGGAVCAPIFREIAEKIIRQFAIEPVSAP